MQYLLIQKGGYTFSGVTAFTIVFTYYFAAFALMHSLMSLIRAGTSSP